MKEFRLADRKEKIARRDRHVTENPVNEVPLGRPPTGRLEGEGALTLPFDFVTKNQLKTVSLSADLYTCFLLKAAQVRPENVPDYVAAFIDNIKEDANYSRHWADAAVELFPLGSQEAFETFVEKVACGWQSGGTYRKRIAQLIFIVQRLKEWNHVVRKAYASGQLFKRETKWNMGVQPGPQMYEKFFKPEGSRLSPRLGITLSVLTGIAVSSIRADLWVFHDVFLEASNETLMSLATGRKTEEELRGSRWKHEDQVPSHLDQPGMKDAWRRASQVFVHMQEILIRLGSHSDKAVH